MATICPACQNEVDDPHAAYCPQCGSALAQAAAPLSEEIPTPMAPVPPLPAPAPAGEVSQEERNWAMAAHLSALVTVVGVPSLVGPLVVWLIKKDQLPFVDDQGREALNFNISFLIYGVVAAISMFVLVGFLLLPIVIIAWLVLVIVAAVRASGGERYRYPLTIRFIS